MKKLVLGFVVLSVLGIMIGCGGGSSSSSVDTPPTTVTGVFQDAVVAGLNYECSSGTTGVTNSLGEYTCNAGDTVEFFLGNYSLGSATASSGIITPLTLYPDDMTAAIDVLQLLQTIDNGDDGTITIQNGFDVLDSFTVRPGEGGFDDGAEDEIGSSLTPDGDAMEHFIKNSVADKTVYLVDNDSSFVLKLEINNDLTGLTMTSLVGDDHGIVSDHSLNISGYTFNGMTLIDYSEEYLLFDDPDESSDVRLYFNLQNAGEFMLGNLTKNRIFYIVDEAKTFADLAVFSSGGGSIIQTILNAAAGEEVGSQFQHTVVIDGLKLNGSTLINTFSDYLLFENEQDVVRFYHEQFKSRALSYSGLTFEYPIECDEPEENPHYDCTDLTPIYR